MIKIVRAKLHGLHVTQCDLNYHGSITIDSSICQKAGIIPLEFVYIWNKNSGARISTYVIYGEPRSKCCVLNGAAARTCQIGDEVIISAYEYITDVSQVVNKKPKVLCFDQSNNISDSFSYDVEIDDNVGYKFKVLP